MATPGRFVWYDVMTTDVEATRAFYSKLFGWAYKDMEIPGMGTYPMIHAGAEGIGGVVGLDPAQGVPSHWIAYVTVDDVAAAAERAQAAGGTVCVPATPIPDVGTFAVVTDPAGAVISPFASIHPPQPEAQGAPAAGTVCWNELLTTDPEAARRFYQALFGWGHGTMDMGPAGTYHLFKRDGRDVAGMMQMPPGAEARPFWLPYFATADVDAGHEQAVGLGARSYVPPRDIPGVGRFAVLADPVGASFALFRG